MATVAEIDDAVKAARSVGCKDLIIMKCNSGYPANPEETNLRTIPHMSSLFNCLVGLSDHSLGIGAAVASVAFGAVAIEKHFVLSHQERTVDSAFSIDTGEMNRLVIESKRAWRSLGNISYGPTEAEISAKTLRRSLYIAKDLVKGALLTEKDIRIVRPGMGLAPKYMPIVLGKKIVKNVCKGDPVSWDMI